MTCRAAENLEDAKMAQRQTQETPTEAAAGGPNCAQPAPAGAFKQQDQGQGTDTPMNDPEQIKLHVQKPWGCHTCLRGLAWMCHSATSTWDLFPFKFLRPHVIDDSSSADSPVRIKYNRQTNISFLS